MAALGYGPTAGLLGVPSPEDSKSDVGRISLSSGEPLDPVKMRVGPTHAWMRITWRRRPGLRRGARFPAPVSAQAGGPAPF